MTVQEDSYLISLSIHLQNTWRHFLCYLQLHHSAFAVLLKFECLLNIYLDLSCVAAWRRRFLNAELWFLPENPWDNNRNPRKRKCRVRIFKTFYGWKLWIYYISPYIWPRRPTAGLEVKLYSFLNLGGRLGKWSTPRPGRFTPEKHPVSIL
jgi:hypothetical protein